MRLVFHGGKCCGIKTIYGFDYSPDHLVSAVEAVDMSEMFMGHRRHDCAGSHVRSDLDFFTDAAPKETLGERFDRLVAFCEKHRPSGVIECVLAESPNKTITQYTRWNDFLESRGFRMVTTALNSNTRNEIFIYHKITSPEPPATTAKSLIQAIAEQTGQPEPVPGKAFVLSHLSMT